MKKHALVILKIACATLFIIPFSPAHAEDDFGAALSEGKFDFSARYRYEHVDDNIAMDQANASTIRTTLGYKTGTFYGFGGRLLLQDVRDVFEDDFNDATGRPGAKTQFAVVADPSDTDFIEGYMSFDELDNTIFKAGRQIITYRTAPFHRFMGTVLWRQNWQNHDAITVQNKSLAHTTIHYAYSWNVNRIFTEEAATSVKRNFDSDSHFVNVQYDGLSFEKLQATLEGYAYFLDFDNSATNSTETVGARLSGGIPVTDSSKAIFTVEYAMQDDYGSNTASVDEDYFLGEIGGKFKFDTPLSSLSIKFSYELLEGNGMTSFRTPLATGHAFQGWTDRFLTTPADGIEDFYITAVATLWGAKFIVSYHDINADNLGYDYGEELDLLLTKTFKEHYTFGIKYGVFSADRNTANIANNGSGSGLTNDVSKIWAWTQIKF